ncbi:MAG: hypothetical protein ABFR63_04080 [Thermodesulfobacteriota bacterium]
MMKFHNSLSILILATLLITTGFCINAPAQENNPVNVCELFTKTDAQALFKTAVSGQRDGRTSFPAGHKCRYTYKKNGDVFGVTFRLSTSTELQEEGINDSASDLFSRQKKARTSGGHAQKNFTLIQAIGDDAFWNGNALWVLIKENVLIIDVDSSLAGSFPDRQAADTAQSDQDLGLSREVAAIILPKM